MEMALGCVCDRFRDAEVRVLLSECPFGLLDDGDCRRKELIPEPLENSRVSFITSKRTTWFWNTH